jgi:hypothetical protein
MRDRHVRSAIVRVDAPYHGPTPPPLLLALSSGQAR